MSKVNFRVGLIGNPNSGKSSLFNALTGLDQHVGNFPGVTVEKAEGKIYLEKDKIITLIDFPGSYSLHANTTDEFILTEHILKEDQVPQAFLYILDLRNIDQQLLLLTQILDLNIPTFVVMTNTESFSLDYISKVKLSFQSKMGIPFVDVNYRTKKGIPEIYSQLKNILDNPSTFVSDLNIAIIDDQIVKDINLVQQKYDYKTLYQAILNKHYYNKVNKSFDGRFPIFTSEESIRFQIQETLNRYKVLGQWVAEVTNQEEQKFGQSNLTKNLDKFATHPILGFGVFFLIMYFVFQAIFALASFPMDWIEGGFAMVNTFIKDILPQHWMTDLLTDGLLAGLSGVLVFIPQIAILFFLIGFLEECGYMARVVYLFDYLLRKFGLNGRSLVGLISGGACAVPAIMSARSIPSYSERIATMFIIPLIPCSARIPVYVVLIAFLVPVTTMYGVFSVQVLIFFGLYLMSIIVALLISLCLKQILPQSEVSYLLIQLPDYQLPYFKKVLIGSWLKVKSFILEAGKVIIIISIVLWFLSSFSFPGEFDKLEKNIAEQCKVENRTAEECEKILNGLKLEHSFAGKFGRLLEPIIKPLGFDWKIGIALITSFAAREVFVGTMSTIYQIGDNSDEKSLHHRLEKEVRADGSKFFDFKTSLSLIVFYAFALQCMSTISVMRRETNGWKWPIIQLLVMSALAYFSSLLVYQLL